MPNEFRFERLHQVLERFIDVERTVDNDADHRLDVKLLGSPVKLCKLTEMFICRHDEFHYQFELFPFPGEFTNTARQLLVNVPTVALRNKFDE
jgi:hypothetical protein